MKSLIIIGGVDLTPYVEIGSYKVGSSNEYTTWIDANYRTHREIERTRIKGEAVMSFINGYDNRMTLSDMLGVIASATAYDVTTIDVYDMSKGEMATINAYVDVEGEEHYGTDSQNFDKVTITIEEC